MLRVHHEIEREIARTSLIHVPADFAQRESMSRLQKLMTSAKSKEFAEGLSKYSQERYSSENGVVSLTEDPLSRLMWAHYAESHAGFVAEFAAQDQFEYEGLTACGCHLGPIHYAVKVKYPSTFKFEPWTSENIVNACCSKHPAWKDEQEWRTFWPLEGSMLCDIDCQGRPERRYCLRLEPTDITRVIFGMRMNENVEKRLRDMLNQAEFKHVQKQTTAIDSETGELNLKPL